MIYLLILAVHLLATIAKLVRPGGVRAVVAGRKSEGSGCRAKPDLDKIEAKG